MTAAQTSPRPAHSADRDRVRVLHGCQLRTGIGLEETSRFRDEVWNLTPAVLQTHVKRQILNFARVPDRFVLAAKQLCYGMLSGDLPPGEARTGISSVIGTFAELVRFFDWLDNQPHARCRHLATVAGADIGDYQTHLMTILADSPGTRMRARAAVRRLWRWRNHLDDALSFDPRHLDGWGETKAAPRHENLTARIPEPVLGVILGWATRFIDDFACDIIAACQQRATATDTTVSTPRTMDIRTRLRRLLDDHIEHRRPIPGWTGKPNLHHLARQLGSARGGLNRYRHDITAAAAITGLTDGLTIPVAVTGHIDNTPWIPGFIVNPRALNDVDRLAMLLHTACYIVLAFLSGMRNGEIKHLKRGCLRTETDSTGRPYRWKVASIAFKGESDPQGTPAVWSIGSSAARALTVLESLQPITTQWLFAKPLHANHSQPDTASAMSTAHTNKYLNDFITWINDYCAAGHRTDAVPNINGQAWRLVTRQFRRTLAWFIARRPGGTIAGALAFRHHSIQMFEGYAGTSESGFRAEVESEQALARGEGYLAMIDAHQHNAFTGPAAAEATKRLADFGSRARFGGHVVTDPKRLSRILANDDPAVYPGECVTCVHDHTKALCLKAQTTRSEALPDHGGCKPLAWRNVALTGDNITAWENELDRISQHLSTGLPPLLAAQLSDRRDALQQFLASHGKNMP